MFLILIDAYQNSESQLTSSAERDSLAAARIAETWDGHLSSFPRAGYRFVEAKPDGLVNSQTGLREAPASIWEPVE